MSKKFVKSIAAAAAALVMATQAMAFSASAAVQDYYYYNGIYYSSSEDATAAAGGNSSAWEIVPYYRIPTNADRKYYDPATKKIYNTREEAIAAGVSNPVEIYVGVYYNSTTNHTGSYYSSYTGRYYNTYEDALRASRGIAGYVTYVGGYWNGYWNGNWNGYFNSSYTGFFYSTVTKRYYSSYTAALKASRGNAACVIAVGYLYNPSLSAEALGSIYKYYYNGVAYPSLQAAIDAGGTVGVDIYYSVYGNTERVGYYYYYNGTYYGTLEAAKRAGGTELGVDITYVPYGYYGNTNNTFYTYTDPYYTIRNTLTTNKVTPTKPAEAGVPYIYGKKNRAGWDTVIKYIKNVSKGSEIKVDMNGCYVLPKKVLEALDGKNITLTCVLDNGVTWAINGKDVDTAQDITVYTEYNIDFIPNTLVKKASKDAVAKAQIGVSNNYDGFGSEVSMTVKFASKRAGCTAVIYRYNPDNNTLKGVTKAKVRSDGTCTFDAVAGGPYLIVLK